LFVGQTAIRHVRSSGVCFGGVGRSAGSFMRGSLSSSSIEWDER
jgi:hypothetical protein